MGHRISVILICEWPLISRLCFLSLLFPRIDMSPICSSFFLFSFSSSQFIPLYKLYFLFRTVSSPFKYCRYILFALIKLYCYTVRVILLNLWSFSLQFFPIFYEFHCAVSECLQLFNKHSFEFSSSSCISSLLSSMAFILGAPAWSISSISLLCVVSSGATTCLC